MKSHKKLRICLAASSGGHLTELLKLSMAWEGYEIFSVTTTDVVRENLQELGNVYVIGECNRWHPLKVLKTILFCIKPILYERPDVVISAGAAAGCIACFLGKAIGAKVIWIDSIANVDKISLSGWIVKDMADMFLVQWPELTPRYKKVEHIGAIV